MRLLLSIVTLALPQSFFGDLFLEEIRAYREQLLARHEMVGLYPIWKRDTGQLIREFLGLGFKTAVVCVDPAQLDPAFVGKVIEEEFLAQLPPHVDPCGENGEFHTFVFDGPIFNEPIEFSFGEIAHRDSFWFCDLIPDGIDRRWTCPARRACATHDGV